MNRKICYLILLLVQVLGALFQVFMLLSGEPGNGENPSIIWLSILQILLWLLIQVLSHSKNLERPGEAGRASYIRSLPSSQHLLATRGSYCFVWYGGGNETFSTSNLSDCLDND